MFVSQPLPDAVFRGLILAPIALLWVVTLTRVVGLRMFSKMTAFDFVATIASGSLLANAATSTDWAGFLQPIAALASLALAQVLLAFVRQRSAAVRRLLENEPRVLLRDGEIDGRALRATRVAHSDVVAKLREANALKRGRVHAVVLETTGDMSVLHGAEEEAPDDELFEGVRS